ncbi:Zinc finger, C6HC-type [Niveomyces insectorum RCEF 264]|uniref:RBR-type E3 ubiquitin transferase n=1 Tax=Niveomyces insectorum RCEF 264 TaxID=1081102 RepID=A0A167X132_9HYPO|nr:Zinc finger, C6HC-type [Niveomyces insectorum RCEF 264]
MSLENIDAETARLIIELQLDDLSRLCIDDVVPDPEPQSDGSPPQENDKDATGDNCGDAPGENGEKTTTADAQLAVDHYRAILTAQLALVNERSHAVAVADAADEPAADGSAADGLAADGPVAGGPVVADAAAAATDEQAGEAAKPENAPETVQEQDGSHERPQTHRATVSCVACGSIVFADDGPGGAIRAPCKHDYCAACIFGLFDAATKDETLFPPRCCRQTIPLGDDDDEDGTGDGNTDCGRLVRAALPPATIATFRAKALEFSTANRIYCHDPTCSTFIPPSTPAVDVDAVDTANTADAVVCPRCNKATCTLCKTAAHADFPCPDNESDKQMLALAAEQGWRRCNACQHIVELNTGCNHITCRCKAEFCYKCGEKWKTCPCDSYDEIHLVANAVAAADREPDAGRRNAAQRNARVQQIRDYLVDHHDCDPHRWRSRGGAFQCSECHHHLPEYIYECRHCRILACRRCRYNRL